MSMCANQSCLSGHNFGGCLATIAKKGGINNSCYTRFERTSPRWLPTSNARASLPIDSKVQDVAGPDSVIRAFCPKIQISNGFFCQHFLNLHHFLFGTPSSWGHGGYSKKVMVRFPPKLLYLYVEYPKKGQSRRKTPTQRLAWTNRLGGWIFM